jgi:hypothetical protein
MLPNQRMQPAAFSIGYDLSVEAPRLMRGR